MFIHLMINMSHHMEFLIANEGFSQTCDLGKGGFECETRRKISIEGMSG